MVAAWADPVGDRLMDDTEKTPDGTLAHAFEIELDGLFVDGSTMPLLLGEGSEGTLAGEAAIVLGPGTIVAPVADGMR